MRNIKKIVYHLTMNYKTSDPWEIARKMNIFVQVGDLQRLSGCQLKIMEQSFIYVNQTLDPNMKRIVVAHELGHCILHSHNCHFFSWGEEFYKQQAEIEAHTFAAELLISDALLSQHPHYSRSQLADLTGYTERLLQFKELQPPDLANPCKMEHF